MPQRFYDFFTWILKTFKKAEVSLSARETHNKLIIADSITIFLLEDIRGVRLLTDEFVRLLPSYFTLLKACDDLYVFTPIDYLYNVSVNCETDKSKSSVY